MQRNKYTYLSAGSSTCGLFSFFNNLEENQKKRVCTLNDIMNNRFIDGLTHFCSFVSHLLLKRVHEVLSPGNAVISNIPNGYDCCLVNAITCRGKLG